MQTKLISNNDGRTFAIAFEPGDEVAEGLLDFAKEYNLTAARFTAIGALKRAKLGFFEIEKQDYYETVVDEQVEVLSLTGNVALHRGSPKIHAHVVLGKRDGTALGGHLLEAVVDPTLEVMLVESPASLQRQIDERTGLPLLHLEPQAL